MTLVDVGPDRLTEYATVSIARTVKSIFRLDVPDHGLGGIRFVEEPVSPPYQVDLDARGEKPLDWSRRFDISKWGFFLVFDDAGNDKKPVGGASVDFDTPEVNMLEEQRDLGVLWDLRVDPAWRGRGVGTMLVRHAMEWCRARGCTQLKVETQNTNVPACKFYAKMGFTLRTVARFAYWGDPEVEDEAMLLWYMDL